MLKEVGAERHMENPGNIPADAGMGPACLFIAVFHIPAQKKKCTISTISSCYNLPGIENLTFTL